MKTNAERMQEDIETTAPRRFFLDLSNDDMTEFYELASRNGTTPEKILQGFICDLIHGTQTRGSDERMLAQQYLSRCNYQLTPEYTFLTWAVREGRTDEIADLLEESDALLDKADNASSLAFIDPDKAAEEAELEAEYKAVRQELTEIYREYAEEQGRQEVKEISYEEEAEIKFYLHERYEMGERFRWGDFKPARN